MSLRAVFPGNGVLEQPLLLALDFSGDYFGLPVAGGTEHLVLPPLPPPPSQYWGCYTEKQVKCHTSYKAQSRWNRVRTQSEETGETHASSASLKKRWFFLKGNEKDSRRQ